MTGDHEAFGGAGDDIVAFAHAIAHELRTPLSSLAMLMAVLRSERTGIPNHLTELLAGGAAAVARATGLVEALVDFVESGRPGAQRVWVDCDALVQDVVQVLDAGDHVRVEPLPRLHTERPALRRAIHAVIDNALRYSGDRRPEVSVSATVRDGTCALAVADRGIGVPLAFLERVFEPFFRLHGYDQVPGHGLGLSTCARIVERLGGGVSIASREGDGTTVTLTLPIHPP